MADVTRFNAYSEEYLDIEVTFTIDFSVLTPERAAEINAFWINADDRLKHCDGDARDAVSRLAAGFFIERVMENRHTIAGMNHELYTSEGWGGFEYCGITLIDYSGGPPEIEFDDIVVEEVV